MKLPIKTIQSKAKAKRNRDNWKARAEQLQAAVKRKDKLIAELWRYIKLVDKGEYDELEDLE